MKTSTSADDQHGDRGREMVADPGARAGASKRTDDPLTWRPPSACPSSRTRGPMAVSAATNPAANRLPIRSSADEFSTHSDINSEASATPIDRRDRRVLGQGDEHRTHGMIVARNACGSRTSLRFWLNVNPSDRAAWACPNGIVLIPERNVSQTNGCRVDRASRAPPAGSCCPPGTSANPGRPTRTSDVYRASEVNKMIGVNGVLRAECSVGGAGPAGAPAPATTASPPVPSRSSAPTRAENNVN